MDVSARAQLAFLLGLDGSLHEVPSTVRAIIEQAEDTLGPGRLVTWGVLDRMLRGEPTRESAVAPQTALLAALQRRCIVSTLGCLTLAQRVVWLLLDVFDWSVAAVAAEIGQTVTAVQVRRARARGFLGRLEPICSHIAAANPCSCEGRLEVAVATGFLDGVAPGEAADYVPGALHDVAVLVRRIRGTADA